MKRIISALCLTFIFYLSVDAQWDTINYSRMIREHLGPGDFFFKHDSVKINVVSASRSNKNP
ncbi:MAG TPA: hypothetical protein VMW76_05765, partial [Bacteroidales bacterium]|nr:hypothetical protein [Bacteroidales bacterium]